MPRNYTSALLSGYQLVFLLPRGSAGRTPAVYQADIKLGFYVTELIGMGINGVTGDYSRGAAGFMIRDGALAEPVAEITIAGTLQAMFAGLAAANDLKLRRGVDAPA